jgi:hypothetical protein
MHVTVGVRHGRTWRTLTGLATASVLALSALGGGSALSANQLDSWTVGHGTLWTAPPPSGASSSLVSAGSEVGFYEWLHNGDTSNISQLFLTATTSPTAAVAGAVWTIKDANEVQVGSGTCPATTPLACSFGALNAGQTVYVVVAFTTSAGLADGATQNVDFLFNTTGTPPGKNRSHGDAKIVTDSVLIARNGDAAGDFNLNDATITVMDNQKLTGQNRQATLATVDSALTGVAVGDSPDLTTPCDGTLTANFPSWFSCSNLTSLTSVIEVGNGRDFDNPSGGPGIKVIVSFSQMPNQLSGANPYVYHYWVDAGGAHAELITEICTFTGAFPNNAGPCLVPGNKNVTVWMSHNGNMRM